MHGQFVWYELTTPDIDAALKFYPRFTGWGTQRFDKDYVMWTSGGVPIAGIFHLGDEMRERGVPPNWMPYVETNSVDATANQAKSLGGQVIAGPQEIPGTGRFAVIQDPQGAVFGIYKSARPSNAWDGTPVVGRFSWHELMTTDHVKAAEFYRALFGWEKNGEMDMGGGNMYRLFGKGQQMYGGMFDRLPEMAEMHPFWLCYINVRDVGKAVAIATKAGAMVIRPQMDIPGGSIAILGDPQGAGFAVHHVSAPAVAAKPTATPVIKKAAKKVVKKAAKKPAKKAARKAAKAAPSRKSRAKAAKKAPVRVRSTARRRPVAAKKKSASKAARRKKAPARKR
jgi:predicted enzyme related to lactoylglutathione lyase